MHFDGLADPEPDGMPSADWLWRTWRMFRADAVTTYVESSTCCLIMLPVATALFTPTFTKHEMPWHMGRGAEYSPCYLLRLVAF